MPSHSVIVRKGSNKEVDSYSAFFENDHKTATACGPYLKEEGIKRVFVVGYAITFLETSS